MAKAVAQPREVDFVLTLSESEALYLYDALRFTNPTEDYWDEIGGDTVFTALGDLFEEKGISIDFDRGSYAETLA